MTCTNILLSFVSLPNTYDWRWHRAQFFPLSTCTVPIRCWTIYIDDQTYCILALIDGLHTYTFHVCLNVYNARQCLLLSHIQMSRCIHIFSYHFQPFYVTSILFISTRAYSQLELYTESYIAVSLSSYFIYTCIFIYIHLYVSLYL